MAEADELMTVEEAGGDDKGGGLAGNSRLRGHRGAGGAHQGRRSRHLHRYAGGSGYGNLGTGHAAAAAAGGGVAGRGDLRGALFDGGGTGVLGGSRHSVGRDGGVDVHLDAGAVGLVERSASNTLGLVGAGARDHQIEALRVVLGTALSLRAVQGNQLVTQHVLAGGDGFGDLNEPAVVVLDQLVVTSGPGHLGVIGKADAVNLEELELGLVDGGAAAVALGQVVDDGAVV